MTRHTNQEKIASAISRKLNRCSLWARNLDGTIDVYCPARGVVIMVAVDGGITARAAAS